MTAARMDPEESMLRQRGNLVDILGSSLDHGGQNFDSAISIMQRVIDEDAWRMFITLNGKTVEWEADSFEAFVTTPPLSGLGTTMERVEMAAKESARLRAKLTGLVKRDHGGDRKSEDFKMDNIHLDPTPNGTSEAAAIRRLRKHRPELLTRVIAGELSAHAAMIEAGFRHRTITIPVDDPVAAVRALLRRYTAQEIQAAIEQMR